MAVWFARRTGRVFNLRTLLLANYIVVSLVSGVVHLMSLRNVSRGFFDVLSGSADTLIVATLGSILGLVALVAGCMIGLPRSRASRNRVQLAMSRAERWVAVIVLAVILPLWLLGAYTIRNYAANIDSARITTFDGGLARYVFFSNWGVWVFTLGALLLISFPRFQRSIPASVVAGLAVVASAFSLSWNGGRSIVLVMTLPLFLVVWPTLRRIRWLLIPAAIAVGFSYLIAISTERSRGAASESSWLTWLDWEWGRYSMLGFAESYVSQFGFTGGETLFAAVTNVSLGLARLVGIPLSNPDLRSMPEITGQYILGSADTYVVGGLSSELYINFGYAGIAVGYLLLGLAVGFVDRRFAASQSVLVQLFWAYLGSLLILRTLAADANALGGYLLYSGLPVLVAALVAAAMPGERAPNRRSSLRDERRLADRLNA